MIIISNLQNNTEMALLPKERHLVNNLLCHLIN